MSKFKEELFHQVSEKLLELIAGGSFPSGKLPPEDELAEILEISRVTLRDILGDMEANSYITRKKGIGTLINRHALKPQIRLDLHQFLPDPIRKSGYKPSVLLKNLKIIKATPSIETHLNVELNSDVIFIEKIFFADDEPIIDLLTYLRPEDVYNSKSGSLHLPIDFRAAFNRDDVESLDFYLALKTKFLIDYSRSVLEPCLPSDQIASNLRITDDTPLIRMRVDMYDLYGNVVCFSDQFFRKSVIDYTVFQKIIPRFEDVFFSYEYDYREN